MFNSDLYACRLKPLPSWNMWDRVGEMNWLNTWGTMYFTKLYIRPIPPKWTLYRGFIKNGLCKNGKIKLPKLQEISRIINYHHVKVEDHIKPTLCPHLLGKNLPSDLIHTHTHTHTQCPHFASQNKQNWKLIMKKYDSRKYSFMVSIASALSPFLRNVSKGHTFINRRHFSDVKLSWTWIHTTCRISGNLQNANCYKTVNVSNTLWDYISQDFTAQNFYNIYQITKDVYNVCN